MTLSFPQRTYSVVSGVVYTVECMLWDTKFSCNFCFTVLCIGTNDSLMMNMTFEDDNFTIPRVNISITVPQEVLNFSSQGFIFTSYRRPVLFQAVPPDPEEGMNSTDYVADTNVLGFTIANKTFTDLSEPVTITLQSFRARDSMVSCY